jgi:hypothetical protein
MLLAFFHDSRHDPVPTPIAGNDDWGGDETLGMVSFQVGAFHLGSFSKDSVLVLTLAPGAYTAQLAGVGETTGVGLVEIYEVP